MNKLTAPGKMDLQVLLKLFAEFLKVCFFSDIYDSCYNKVLFLNVHMRRKGLLWNLQINNIHLFDAAET